MVKRPAAPPRMLLLLLLPLLPLLPLLARGAAGLGHVVRRAEPSAFGTVEVIDAPAASPGAPAVRFLRCGDAIIGADYLDKTDFVAQSAFLNFAIHQAAAYLDPPPAAALQLGLGAGTVPTHLRALGVRVDAVEVSEAVVAAAADFFGYRRDAGTHGRTFVMDAAVFVESTPVGAPRGYDVVLHDLFVGDNPAHALGPRVFDRVAAKWLKKDTGVLIVNFFGHAAAPAAGVLRALRAVFAHVRCFREVPLDTLPESPANLVFIASDGAGIASGPPFKRVPAAGGEYTDPPALSSFWVQQRFHTFEVTATLDALLATDADRDADALARAAARMRRGYNELLVDFFPPAREWPGVVAGGGRGRGDL